MKIDRHNYEEYFILYMDNELDSDDRCRVEAFVQQHPDLKEELDILMQYKLVPDVSVVYEGKEELMQVNGYSSFINTTNYEEWLVLYMDNELTAEQKVTVEQFMADHPAAKTELAILQQTQLQPEAIVFADKKSLYREEEKVRAVPVRWWRIAAAAVLLITAGIATLVIINNKKAGQAKDDIAKTPATQQKTGKENKENLVTNDPIIKPEDKKENKKNVLPPLANTIQNAVASSVKEKTHPVIGKEKNDGTNKIIPGNSPAAIKNEEPVATNNKPSNNLLQPFNNPYVNTEVTKNTIATIDNNKQPVNKESLTNMVVTTKAIQPLYTSNTSSINNDDINQSGSKKSKLRGFFRKVTRTLEKNTNVDASDDDRVLIGGLAIKL